jgi:hypothetical protein
VPAVHDFTVQPAVLLAGVCLAGCPTVDIEPGGPQPILDPADYTAGTVSVHEGGVQPGMTLLADKDIEGMVLVDADGVTRMMLKTWDEDFPYVTWGMPTAGGRLVTNILRDPIVPPDGLFPDGTLALVDIDTPELVWQWTVPAGYGRIHHEHMELENGHILALISPPIAPFPDISTELVHDDVFVEIDPATDDIVWEWSTAEHYDQLPLTAAERALIVDQDRIDIFHTNSVAPLPEAGHDLDAHPYFRPGNLLVGQRQTNLVFIVDRDSGDIVWSMSRDLGNIGQHMPRMIPTGLPGAGNILLFDNGFNAGWPPETRKSSRVLEVDPVAQTIAWQYAPGDTFYSSIRSGAQRLANGNTLISASQLPAVIEVNSDGDIVWQLDQASSAGHYRAYRIDEAWLTGGDPTSIPFTW